MTDAPDLPPFELGYALTPLRRKLVAAVLRGDKIATAGLATDHAPHTNEPLPKVGDRWLLLGYESVADWRAAHERFWSEHEITDQTLILCEYFRVVERLENVERRGSDQ